MSTVRPLRFCMLTTFYPPWNFGGDGIQVERLAHALADYGHQVTVVCSPEVHRLLARERPPLPRERPGVELVPIADRLVSLVGEYLAGRPLSAKRQLERVFDRRFDVLHFHNPSLLGAPALLGMGSGIKLYTTHEQWLVCPTHTLWRHNREVCEERQCVRCTLRYRRPPQPWRRTRLLHRAVGKLDALIAPSDTSARLHRRFEGATRILRLDHFVPEPHAEPNGWRPAGPYFLYVGRLEPIKGPDLLLEHFRQRPRHDRLVIAGDGSLRRHLLRRARTLPNVDVLGPVSQPMLSSLYAGALATVVPTRGHEAFGLVAVESWAHGVPVIAHDFGALAELLERCGGGIGYVSERELARALDRIRDDEQLRRELGARGRAAYEAHWRPSQHLRRYLDLLLELREEQQRETRS